MNGITFLSSKFTLIQRRLLKVRLCYVMTILLIIDTNAEMKIPSSYDVFCKGEILHVVQMASLNPDEKYFVDMNMNFPSSVIYSHYYSMMNDTGGNPFRVHVRRFVRKCFSVPESEYQNCQPKDWSANPKLVANITNKSLKLWVLEINNLWKVLCRKIRIDVKLNPDLYSVIYVPNKFMIAGGRHREYYYWDSYWIVLGLLRLNMYSTAKGIIENFLYLVETYGFVPNGGRLYHLERSNLPLLIPMVDIYYRVTRDKQFFRKHLGSLEKEFNFWMENRVVNVSKGEKTLKLARFSAKQLTGPRPDHYKKDYNNAESFSTEEEKENYFWEIKAACEAGWNFCSRWFTKNNNTGGYRDIKTRSIIPVDLNAVLFLNAQILSKFFKLTKDITNAAKYKGISEIWMESVTNLLWCEEDGVWFDYDVSTNESRKNFYTSNLVPLWTGCYEKNRKNEIGEKAVKYLIKNEVEVFKGGIPASLKDTGHHWDFPNAIPSAQHMLIVGLRNTKNIKAEKLALQMANYWVRANYIGFTSRKTMYDTYDATIPGLHGKGAAYKAQEGYGWTNGVILDLLYIYHKQIKIDDISNSALPMTPLLSVTIIFIQIYFCFLFNGGNFNEL